MDVDAADGASGLCYRGLRDCKKGLAKDGKMEKGRLEELKEGEAKEL